MIEERIRLGRPVSRRAFLSRGGAAAVALSFPARALAGRRRRLSHWRRSSYKPLIGQRFSVRGTQTKLKLAQVRDLNRHQAGSENAFALIFVAPLSSPRLTEQVPELYHPALGRFRLLIARAQASAEGQPYAAVINRVHA